MCGIAGFIDSKLSNSEAEKTLVEMLQSIGHRGPDARGVFFDLPVALGHNRLSIIDLSADGNQPMEFFDAVITFNGEIYNYIEVREELIKKGYRFKTHSDTEVILAAYREYGERCVDQFMGMWAFALWDLKTHKLFCSRDRFGIKPFYYIEQGGNFYFGSEYKALKKSPVFKSKLNIDQVNRGLQLGWMCYGDETYYENLKALPAAHNLVYANGKVDVSRYWDIDATVKYSGSVENKREKFFDLFDRSIRQHMRSDVEIGGCLSGGLDSSSIASLIATDFPELNFKTFTIYYDGKGGVDERPFANEVLSKYPSLEPYYFTPSDDDIVDCFSKIIDQADVPIAGSSPISQYFVMRLAAEKKIKVVVDGQGADEILGGYMHSFYRLIGGMAKDFKFAQAIRQSAAHSAMQGMNFTKSLDLFLKSMLSGMMSEQQLYATEYKNYFPFIATDNKINFQLNHETGTRLNRFLYHLTFATSLPSLLHYEDRNSMAFSIESRVPFLDHRLVEFVFSLDDKDKIDSGITKKILRESMAPVLPEKIASRKDKKGFVTPGEIKWLRGPLKFLLDGDFSQIDFLNRKRIRQTIDAFKKGDNRNANLVWRIAVLNFWLNR